MHISVLLSQLTPQLEKKKKTNEVKYESAFCTFEL